MKRAIYRRPDPTIATGMFREYRPRISCFHAWEPNVSIGDGVVAARITPGEICMLCAATCRRGTDGRIVEFEAHVVEVAEEEVAA